jgi:hypothetical protein
MQERPENFNDTGGDAEPTLVTPRFDAEEASRAHPVVPLAEAREPFANHPRARARRGPRRPWPPALLAVVLLAVFAAGGVVASKVLRRAQPSPAAAQAPAAVAPAQAAEAPAEPTTEPQTPPAVTGTTTPVEAPREVADTKPEPRAPRVRRSEDAGVVARDAAARDDDFDDRNEGRRDKRRGKRRERAEDDGEKEMRQMVKDAKKKVPRLVDVLVRP